MYGLDIFHQRQGDFRRYVADTAVRGCRIPFGGYEGILGRGRPKSAFEVAIEIVEIDPFEGIDVRMRRHGEAVGKAVMQQRKEAVDRLGKFETIRKQDIACA